MCFWMIVCIVSLQVNGQNAISEKINANHARIAKTKSFSIFNLISNRSLNRSIDDSILKEKQFLEIQEDVIQTIKKNDAEFLQVSLPLENEIIELSLYKANIYAPDFKVVTNYKKEFEPNQGLHYWGIVKDDPNSLVSISFLKNEIVASINVNQSNYTIARFKDSDYHLSYKRNNLNFTPNFQCENITDELELITEREKNLPLIKTTSTGKCVRIHMEVDYSLYQDLGSDTTAVENYINGLFAQVSLLYANEDVGILLSYLNIWTEPSPYTSGNELDDLREQGYRRRHGDLIHLVHSNGYYGIASRNTLCFLWNNSAATGVTGSYNLVPTPSWDVFAVTHEIGHNLGSYHTHDCVWNGNNTQIDGCGQAAGHNGTGPDCHNSYPIPTAGTIMSYCHILPSVGIDFTLGFGPQPGDVIRNVVMNSAYCLTDCSEGISCSDGYQNGDEMGIDCGGSSCDNPCPPTCEDGTQNGDETGIDCGGSSCDPCPPTCTDGIQNGNEEGIDCGGLNCTPCCIVQGNEFFDLSIYGTGYDPTNLDGVTWQITDLSDSIIYQGAYSGLNITEELCLSQECYKLTIDDNGGDMNLRYFISTKNGNTLTFGNVDYGYTESSTFCISNTCIDGIQNGDEIGIDCGGSSCFPCPTCDDEIRNGDETGNDCGGPTCPACSCDGKGLTLVGTIEYQNYGNFLYIISDDSGLTVNSGSLFYFDKIENICVPPGCYTLTYLSTLDLSEIKIIDEYGNLLVSENSINDDGSINFCTTEPPCDIISLQEGWNIVSTDCIPTNPAMEAIFADISSDIIQVKDLTGTFIPDFNINSIGDWDYKSGYYIKASQAVDLPIYGTKVDTDNTDIPLYEGWNLIACWLPSLTPPEDVFATTPEIIEVKHLEGSYIPALNGLNEMGSNHMQKGYGYSVKVSANTSLSYGNDSNGLRTIDPTNALLRPSTYKDTFSKTVSIFPNPVKDRLIFNSTENLENAEVQLYNMDGKLVLTQNISNKEINVQSLPNGVYIYALSQDGHSFHQGRVVVLH